MMDVSVIIPTRNRSACLQKLLAAIATQTFSQDRFEVIVVDNGSTDNTKKVCDSLTELFKNFRYFYDNNPGLHVGRNLGLRQSKGNILVYADDDILPPPEWLSAIYNGFAQNQDVVLIGGSDLPDFDGDIPEWVNALWTPIKGGKMMCDFSVIDLGSEQRYISPYFVFGCNFSIRKKILQNVGGFHPDGMPDELLCYRGDGETAVAEYILTHNLLALFVPGASVKHLVSQNRMTYEYVCKIAYRSGITNAYTELRGGRVTLRLAIRQCIEYLKARFFIDYSDISRIKRVHYLRGYLFLCWNAFTNRRVRKWIHQPNYLTDYSIPM